MMPYLYDTQNRKTTKFSCQGFIFQRQRTQPSEREICQREVYDLSICLDLHTQNWAVGLVDSTSYSRNLLSVDKQLIYSINLILRDRLSVDQTIYTFTLLDRLSVNV